MTFLQFLYLFLGDLPPNFIASCILISPFFGELKPDISKKKLTISYLPFFLCLFHIDPPSLSNLVMLLCDFLILFLSVHVYRTDERPDRI